MKFSAFCLSCLCCALSAFSLSVLAAETPPRVEDTFLVRAVDFQFHGGWQPSVTRGGSPLAVRESGPGTENAEANTVIDLPQGGEFRIWTRSIDYKTDPGARRYQVLIDGRKLASESNTTGRLGWHWEKVDTLKLDTGQHVLSLYDSGRYYARCDAVLFTKGDFDPNTVEMSDLAPFTLKPVEVEVALSEESEPETVNVDPNVEKHLGATLAGPELRVHFYESKDEQGRPVILRQSQMNSRDEASALEVRSNAEPLYLLYSPDLNINTSTYFPSWDSPYNRTSFELNGREYTQAGAPRNPFLAGQSKMFVPREVEIASADTVTLRYESPEGQWARVTWSLGKGDWDIRMEVEYQVPREGYYSWCFAPFKGWERGQTQEVLLSPMYQFRRIPDEPLMVTSAETPHPSAMVEVLPEGASSPVSFAVTAEPENLAFTWPQAQNARYGFTLLNPQGEVQPVVFAPVLGLEGSRLEAGQNLKSRLRVIIRPGSLHEMLTYISDEVMGVTDYREPYESSLTDAVLEMIRLIKDDVHSGWDPKLKGFYNIEIPGGVSQGSPLMLLSVANLTRDEHFYQTRALPTIEYLLTRPSLHFATRMIGSKEYAMTPDKIVLTVPNKSFGTDVWEGVDRLTARLNPWVQPLAFDEGKPRLIKHPHYPDFSQYLWASRLDPQHYSMEDATVRADRFVAAKVDRLPTRPFSIDPHYNVAFHPHWWELLDLYDVTGEERYLEAAEEIGYQTVAGMWSFPMPPVGDVLIHPDGQFTGVASVIHNWYGWSRYTTGYPRTANDTPAHEVPAWLVSPVGLGFEQPSTYYRSSGGMMMTMMTSWAGHLERLADRTGKDIFRTYARNAIIGRWANWPGYYIDGFTDLFHDPEYPYNGPDVGRFYFHHIPVQLALTLDFLVAEMENRSEHQISIPWVKQQGYAQFTNRIYGDAPGTFYGEHQANLWLDPDLVEIDTPAVNYLTARGRDQFWVILMNETSEPVSIHVSINHDKAGTHPDSPWLRYIGGAEPRLMRSPLEDAPVTLPAKGLVALAVEAKALPEPVPLSAVEEGHVVQMLPDPWGEVHAFRIRSEFGKDALYVVAMGHPEVGARARIDIQDGDWTRRESDEYPYEMTVYPWPVDRDMRFTFVGTDADGTEVSSEEFVLPGTR